jgi:hypothetical protein
MIYILLGIFLSIQSNAQVCFDGKACGDSCIERSKHCDKGVGTAMNASEMTPEFINQRIRDQIEIRKLWAEKLQREERKRVAIIEIANDHALKILFPDVARGLWKLFHSPKGIAVH